MHKNGIVLKELKESRVCFKLLKHINYDEDEARIKLQEECEELIKNIATRIKNAKLKMNLK
jgi:four helix bundle protein